MELITPDLGLIFWTGLVFILLLFVLTKFVWKPVLGAVNAREQKISESLELAEKTKNEMLALQSQNENLLKEAKIERDAMVKDAKATAMQMVDDAKNKAKIEFDKIVAAGHEVVKAETAAAIVELKTQVATISLEIAEKIIRGELSSDDKQKMLADKLAADINLN